MNKQGYTTQKENKGEGACSKIKNKASNYLLKGCIQFLSGAFLLCPFF